MLFFSIYLLECSMVLSNDVRYVSMYERRSFLWELVICHFHKKKENIHMPIIFNKYEQAGVKEYWIVEPDIKLVSVFTLQENQRYGRPELYSEDDEIKVGIFPDLIVDLKPVFRRLEP